MRRAHVLVTLSPGLAAWLASFSKVKVPALDPEEMDLSPELLDTLAVGAGEGIKAALQRSTDAVKSITKSTTTKEADTSLKGALSKLGDVSKGLKGLWGRLTKPKEKPTDPTAPKLLPLSERIPILFKMYGNRNLLAGDEMSKQLLAGAVMSAAHVAKEVASNIAGIVSEAVPYVSAVKAAGELLASTVELARTVETLLNQKLMISQQLVLTAEAGVDEMTRALHDACIVFANLRKQARDAREKMSKGQKPGEYAFAIVGMLSQATLEALDMSDDGFVVDNLELHMGAQLADAFGRLEVKLASLFDREGRCTAHFATMGLVVKVDKERRDLLAKLRLMMLPTPQPGKEKERAALVAKLFPADTARTWSEAELTQLALVAPPPPAKEGAPIACPWGLDVIMDIKLSTAREEDGECSADERRVGGRAGGEKCSPPLSPCV